ncbi:MAG: hypothetical protein V3V35_03395, partial [Dehalococcoidia bacterium]
MTAGSTRSQDPLPPAQEPARRLSFFNGSGSLFTPSEGWTSAALLLSAQLVAVVAIQTSGWIEPMPRLWLVAPLGFLVGMGVAKVRGPFPVQLVLLALALALGAGVAFWETAGTLSQGGLVDRFDETLTRLDQWSGAIGGQGISNDRLPFALILSGLAWAMAYFSSWFLFRFRWAWPAVSLPAIALLTNQTYLPNSHYPFPLTFFLLFSILLIARVHFVNRVAVWRTLKLDQRISRRGFLLNAAVLTALVFTVGWAIPTQKIVIDPIRDRYQSARSPWAGLEDQFERVFAGIPSKRAAPLHGFGA